MKVRLALMALIALLLTSTSLAVAQKPIMIFYPAITDAKGIARMEYFRGQRVCVWITVYAAPVKYVPPLRKKPFKILVVVKANGVAYLTGVVSGTITTGEIKTYSFNFTIPKEVPTGFHVVKLMAWNGFISTMLTKWAAMASPIEASFFVKG